MKTPTKVRPNQLRMAKAIANFLDALGVDQADPNFANTPERVAYAWATEFVAGYQLSPAALLQDRFPVSKRGEGELVVVSGLHFRSMCPHHLMPYSGVAHVAYVPGQWVLGFGRIAALLQCFAQRLVLQEELARNVTDALMTFTQCTGAACILEAQQTCLTHRQGEQHQAWTHAEAYDGLLREGALRNELWTRLGRGR